MIIELKNIRFNFGSHHIFKSLNLKINTTNLYFLTGANSSGKTVLLKLLGLQLKPSGGQILIDDKVVNYNNIKELAKLRQKIGFIFDEHKLLTDLNVFDNIALPLRIMGENERKVREKTNSMIEWSGLKDKTRKMPNELSSSEQKLISIARSIIKRPQIILADELTKDLDSQTNQRIMLLLHELVKQNTTVVLSTHDHTWANNHKQPILIIKDHNVHLS